SSDGGPNDRLRINGDLTWSNALFLITNIEVLGNFTIISTNPNPGQTNIFFTGTRQQTFTNNGGENPHGTWTVNKPFGRVTVASNLVIPSNSRLDVISGILYLGPGANLSTPTATSGPMTVGPNGKILADSNNVITLGDDVVNNG